MKKFWAIATVLLAVLFITPGADAKRLGGGKSFGSSFNTAPSQPKTTSLDSGKTAAPAASQPAGAKKSGLMGGLLGGLLAGGLIAALLGGAFEGINLVDMLIIGGIAFLLFRLLRGARRASLEAAERQPAYASIGGMNASPASAPTACPPGNLSTSSTPAGDQIPFNLPPGFDLPGFLDEARDHYRILQQAWNDNDLGKIREYVSPELFEQLDRERRSLTAAPRTEILYLDVELVRAEVEFGVAQLSLKFSGGCRDGAEGEQEVIDDIWHLQRELNTPKAPWHVVGIDAGN